MTAVGVEGGAIVVEPDLLQLVHLLIHVQKSEADITVGHRVVVDPHPLVVRDRHDAHRGTVGNRVVMDVHGGDIPKGDGVADSVGDRVPDKLEVLRVVAGRL
jgi:hypothetical protein